MDEAVGPSGLSEAGAYRYTPAPGYHGTDTFTYFVQDAKNEKSNTATVSVTVIPKAPTDGQNSGPIAVPDVFSIEQGKTLEIAAPGVLTWDNPDIDLDGDPLTAHLVSPPRNGKVELAEDGAFRYTPNPDFFSDPDPDEFNYKVNDGKDDSEPVPVKIYVLNSQGSDPGSTPDCPGPTNELKRLAEMPGYEQPDDISSGPTAVQEVLKYYGITAGLGPLKTTCNTRWLQIDRWGVNFGMTHPDSVKKGLDDYGVPASVKTGQSLQDILQYIDQDRPPIILVRSDKIYDVFNAWHYFVVVGYKCGTGEIHGLNPDQWYDGSLLETAWMFSTDTNGNPTKELNVPCPNVATGMCKDGKIRCPLCLGVGSVDIKIAGRKIGTKSCDVCGRDGKTSKDCPVCDGRGGLGGDIARKLVESAGVSGHTLIIPDSPPNGTVAVPPLVGKTLDDTTVRL